MNWGHQYTKDGRKLLVSSNDEQLHVFMSVTRQIFFVSWIHCKSWIRDIFLEGDLSVT